MIKVELTPEEAIQILDDIAFAVEELQIRSLETAHETLLQACYAAGVQPGRGRLNV